MYTINEKAALLLSLGYWYKLNRPRHFIDALSCSQEAWGMRKETLFTPVAYFLPDKGNHVETGNGGSALCFLSVSGL